MLVHIFPLCMHPTLALAARYNRKVGRSFPHPGSTLDIDTWNNAFLRGISPRLGLVKNNNFRMERIILLRWDARGRTGKVFDIYPVAYNVGIGGDVKGGREELQQFVLATTRLPGQKEQKVGQDFDKLVALEHTWHH